jgi:lysophospholipase L1-like esterase
VSLWILLLALACGASIWLAVQITPMQSVSAVGQTVRVGAVEPDLSFSGPGELDLFGEAIPTRPHFDGPIRPRLKLAQITIDSQLERAVRSPGQDALGVSLSHRLAAGWTRYCLWETLIAAGCSVVIMVAAAGVRRASGRRTVVMIAAGVLAVSAVNVVGVYLLASGTPRALSGVHTLDDLVGRAPSQPVEPAKGAPLNGVQVVVLGDSTAAGIGNRLVADPSALDRACGRSADSFAAVLARTNGWNVLNLACQGATVRDGLLGVQVRGDVVAPAQLAVAQRAARASTVIVSVGANDLNWAVLTKLCAASPVCDDRASTAYFKEQLATFSQDYLDLLQQLSVLPGHPQVLVNQYYQPFGPDTSCLREDGLTDAKADVLRSRLADVNTVLEQGAETFRFATARPRFDGHELCSKQPFVQGSADQAPLHPTAAGELVIALADQQALVERWGRPSPPPPVAPTSPSVAP